MKYLLYLLIALFFSALSFANDYKVVIHKGESLYAMPMDSVESIDLSEYRSVTVRTYDCQKLSFYDIDSITHETVIGDTLYIHYKESHTTIQNPRVDVFDVSSESLESDIIVRINSRIAKPIIVVKGKTEDGRLRIDSDVDYCIVLDGVNLSSSHACALNSISKQKVSIIIGEGTENTLNDAEQYVFDDEEETSNGCINSLGALTITGNGQLSVNGQAKHAIYAKKSITIKDGTVIIPSAVSDALHSGKNVNIEGGNLKLVGMQGDGIDLDDNFTMTAGCIDMNITGEATKGIKCGKLLNIANGTITAVASGSLKNKKGDLSYCTILKCDSSMTVSGGELHLVNNSSGGKCISVDHNLEIIGGTFYMETSGDGAEYTNANGELDYYTSKCISADDSLCVLRGNIRCLSTGIGGKGIVGGKYVQIGQASDTEYQQEPTIMVETTNSSIVNDVEEDERYGCPKAIKAGEYLNIYSGDIHCTTSGMGGEGIECGKEFYFYGGSLECNCFDDGINVGEKLEVIGGQIYCNSTDNDGIDSNGSIYLKGGLVVAINQKEPNESIDSENAQLFLQGTVFIGIGSRQPKVGSSTTPYYNSQKLYPEYQPRYSGINLEKGKYLYAIRGGSVIATILVPKNYDSAFVTITTPDFFEGEMGSLYIGNQPIGAHPLLGGNVFVDGMPDFLDLILDFFPDKNYDKLYNNDYETFN